MIESIQVIDEMGKVCSMIPNINNVTYELDLSSLKSGSYSVVLQKNGKSLTKQLIKL
jgi:hypothetical protein